MPELPPSGPVRHEIRDINARAICLFTVALIALIALSQITVGALFSWFGERHAGTAANRSEAQAPNPPAPRLQPDPVGEMERFRQRENELLNNYAWVDRERGIVRIPIERAMDIVAKRGLPGAKETRKSPLEMRQERANREESSP